MIQTTTLPIKARNGYYLVVLNEPLSEAALQWIENDTTGIAYIILEYSIIQDSIDNKIVKDDASFSDLSDALFFKLKFA